MREYSAHPDLASMDTPVPEAASAADGWEAMYRDNVTWVYRFIFGRLGNRADAEDITAEVFMRALPRLKTAAPAKQLRAYLAATARTVLADHWRNGYDVEFAAGDDGSLVRPIEEPATDPDVNVRRANRLLARLPDKYRRVLELRFLLGYSLRETAEALAISVGNAKVMQHRALRRAAELGDEDVV